MAYDPAAKANFRDYVSPPRAAMPISPPHKDKAIVSPSGDGIDSASAQIRFQKGHVNDAAAAFPDFGAVASEVSDRLAGIESALLKAGGLFEFGWMNDDGSTLAVDRLNDGWRLVFAAPSMKEPKPVVNCSIEDKFVAAGMMPEFLAMLMVERRERTDTARVALMSLEAAESMLGISRKGGK